MFDPQLLKQDFPILSRMVHGKPLVYLDNAATSQKPRAVISAITEYYENHNANVHRGVHLLGDESTQVFHQARRTIASFFGAESTELITVRNTTEAINQVAYAWGDSMVGEGDVIMVSQLEHHSNVVPWQQLAKRKKAELVFIPVSNEGQIDLEFVKSFDFKHRSVKLLALSHVSNVLGSVLPLAELTQVVRQLSPQTRILIDGAQAAAHLPISFAKANVDFYVVSAHKMLGPMGIGGLLVRKELLKDLPPFLFGGGMIAEVTEASATFAEDPEERYTAGTPDVAGLVGWAAACTYLSDLGMDQVYEHDQSVVKYALSALAKVPEIELLGPTSPGTRIGSIAFLYPGVHAHDVGQVLDSEGIAVRSGHHCTMPLHTHFQWQATLRASFQVYTSTQDIDLLVSGLAKVKKVFKI